MSLNYQLTNPASYNTENQSKARELLQAPTKIYPPIYVCVCLIFYLWSYYYGGTVLTPQTYSYLLDSTLFLSTRRYYTRICQLSKNKIILLCKNPAINALLYLLVLSSCSLCIYVYAYIFFKKHFFLSNLRVSWQSAHTFSPKYFSIVNFLKTIMSDALKFTPWTSSLLQLLPWWFHAVLRF